LPKAEPVAKRSCLGAGLLSLAASANAAAFPVFPVIAIVIAGELAAIALALAIYRLNGSPLRDAARHANGVTLPAVATVRTPPATATPPIPAGDIRIAAAAVGPMMDEMEAAPVTRTIAIAANSDGTVTISVLDACELDSSADGQIWAFVGQFFEPTDITEPASEAVKFFRTRTVRP
jgi:hypothetical protein